MTDTPFDLRFWQLDMAEQGTWYLDWTTGEQLQAWLEDRKQDERGTTDRMFRSIEDINGCLMVIRVDMIISLSASTPDTRERSADADGFYEAIRRYSVEKSKRKWGNNAEEYEG